MANEYAIWKFSGYFNRSRGGVSRPVTDEEMEKIVNHEIIKQFKPWATDDYLMIKINPRWYELGGAMAVLDRVHIHLLAILGIEPEPADLPEFKIPPKSTVVYSDAPACFGFEFSWDDPELLVNYRFEFLDQRPKLRKWMTNPPNGYYDFLGRMEAYGVHDGTGGEDEHGMDTVVGFHSYEIDPAKHMEVMKKWHNYFAKKGYSLGPIHKVTN